MHAMLRRCCCRCLLKEKIHTEKKRRKGVPPLEAGMTSASVNGRGKGGMRDMKIIGGNKAEKED